LYGKNKKMTFLYYCYNCKKEFKLSKKEANAKEIKFLGRRFSPMSGFLRCPYCNKRIYLMNLRTKTLFLIDIFCLGIIILVFPFYNNPLFLLSFVIVIIVCAYTI